MMRKEEVEDTPNVVASNFSIKTHHVEILFNSSARHSLTPRQSLLNIALSYGKLVNCQELFIDCPILLQGHDFLANLYKFELS